MIFSKEFSKIPKVHEKHDFNFFTFLPGVEYDHGSAKNKKTENEKSLFIKEKKYPKVIKVDVTEASLSHAMKKLKYFKGFFSS